MPRAKNQSRTTSQGGNSMPDMINCNLSDDQKATIKANIPTIKVLMEFVEESLADNYKITLSYDYTTDCYSVYMIGKPTQAVNSNLMLSAHAPVVNGALALVMFKHQVALNHDWNAMSQGNNGNNWR